MGFIQNDREHLYGVLDYVAKGKARVMTEIFPLEEISNAYYKVANGNVRFKAVIPSIGITQEYRLTVRHKLLPDTL
jgi:alcohol dehydrogenase